MTYHSPFLLPDLLKGGVLDHKHCCVCTPQARRGNGSIGGNGMSSIGVLNVRAASSIADAEKVNPRLPACGAAASLWDLSHPFDRRHAS